MKVSTNVKIAMQCFENLGGGQIPQMVARLVLRIFAPCRVSWQSIFAPCRVSWQSFMAVQLRFMAVSGFMAVKTPCRVSWQS